VSSTVIFLVGGVIVVVAGLRVGRGGVHHCRDVRRVAGGASERRAEPDRSGLVLLRNAGVVPMAERVWIEFSGETARPFWIYEDGVSGPL
jgi:hypothetical protein